jgi:hypothetical protein
MIVNGRIQNGGGRHLGFFAFPLRFSFCRISPYVKYILAKFGENPIDSNELEAYYVKFKMAAAAILVLDSTSGFACRM